MASVIADSLRSTFEALERLIAENGAESENARLQLERLRRKFAGCIDDAQDDISFDDSVNPLVEIAVDVLRENGAPAQRVASWLSDLAFVAAEINGCQMLYMSGDSASCAQVFFLGRRSQVNAARDWFLNIRETVLALKLDYCAEGGVSRAEANSFLLGCVDGLKNSIETHQPVLEKAAEEARMFLFSLYPRTAASSANGPSDSLSFHAGRTAGETAGGGSRTRRLTG